MNKITFYRLYFNNVTGEKNSRITKNIFLQSIERFLQICIFIKLLLICIFKILKELTVHY